MLAYGYQNIAGFDYDDNGNRSSLKYYLSGSRTGSTTTINYYYNLDNMLTGYTTTGGLTFSFDAAATGDIDGLGRLTYAGETVTKTTGAVTHNYTYNYDMLSQLTDATITNIGGTWSAVYNYHKNGDMNYRTIQSSTTNFAYLGNQMKTATGGEHFTLNYDDNGNMKNLPVSDVNALVYNWDNKLRSAQKGTATMSLRYDPAGNRIRKVSSVLGTRKYITDIVGGLPAILMELNTSGNILKTYIYGNSQILAQHDGSFSSSRYFYLHDRLGSVRQLIDSSGVVKNYYTYNPFGETLETTESITNPFKFTGQYYDSEIGQYYFRARQYHPHLYRFTSRDIIDGQFDDPLSLHKYLYCGNDPINRTDPTGLWWEVTHRQFGRWGWGYDAERGTAPFDYALLDKVYSPFDPRYTWMHFRSRENIYPELMYAAGESDVTQFEYLMHEWQDAYVHYDRGFEAPFGHAKYDLTHKTSADDPHDPVNVQNHAYERCNFTTTVLEEVWFKYNITDDDPLASWFDNPRAKLPTENPWLSAWKYSWLIDY